VDSTLVSALNFDEKVLMGMMRMSLVQSST